MDDRVAVILMLSFIVLFFVSFIVIVWNSRREGFFYPQVSPSPSKSSLSGGPVTVGGVSPSPTVTPIGNLMMIMSGVTVNGANLNDVASVGGNDMNDLTIKVKTFISTFLHGDPSNIQTTLLAGGNEVLFATSFTNTDSGIAAINQKESLKASLVSWMSDSKIVCTSDVSINIFGYSKFRLDVLNDPPEADAKAMFNCYSFEICSGSGGVTPSPFSSSSIRGGGVSPSPSKSSLPGGPFNVSSIIGGVSTSPSKIITAGGDRSAGPPNWGMSGSGPQVIWTHLSQTFDGPDRGDHWYAKRGAPLSCAYNPDNRNDAISSLWRNSVFSAYYQYRLNLIDEMRANNMAQYNAYTMSSKADNANNVPAKTLAQNYLKRSCSNSTGDSPELSTTGPTSITVGGTVYNYRFLFAATVGIVSGSISNDSFPMDSSKIDAAFASMSQDVLSPNESFFKALHPLQGDLSKKFSIGIASSDVTKQPDNTFGFTLAFVIILLVD